MCTNDLTTAGSSKEIGVYGKFASVHIHSTDVNESTVEARNARSPTKTKH